VTALVNGDVKSPPATATEGAQYDATQPIRERVTRERFVQQLHVSVALVFTMHS
jgi:hypothetical protein